MSQKALDDVIPGTTTLYISATRIRRIFGMERRQLLIAAFPVVLLVFASRDFRANIIGLVLGAFLLPILRYTGEYYPFLLDDFFGTWMFEPWYVADTYLDGVVPQLGKPQEPS